MAIGTPGRGSVAELTAALKSGLLHRRFVDVPAQRPAPPPPEPLDVTAPLLPVSGLLGHPAVAKPSAYRPLVRLARRAAKGLLRPWLELQTVFNHRSIGVLETVQSWVHSNLSRAHDRCQQLEAAVADLSHAHQALALRTAECYEELLRDRARLRKLEEELNDCRGRLWAPAPTAEACPPAKKSGGADDPNGRLTESVIETLFVHTRLPAPPAAVLELSPDGPGGPLDLVAIGYETVSLDLRRLPPRHPNFHPGLPGEFAELPCRDLAFDAVVALGTIGRLPPAEPGYVSKLERHLVSEAYRVLRPGGRFIFTAPLAASGTSAGQRAHDRESLAQLVAQFRAVEHGYVARDGDGWVFSNRPPTGADTVLCLVVVEKS